MKLWKHWPIWWIEYPCSQTNRHTFVSQLKPLNHLRRRKSRMLCFISWYIHFFWHLGNLSYFFMSLCSKPPTDVFSNNLWSSCLCTVGWPGLECWEPAFSRMWPRSSVVVKVKVVLCTLVVVFIHMFCQLVCHLWVNIQNEGKLKKNSGAWTDF